MAEESFRFKYGARELIRASCFLFWVFQYCREKGNVFTKFYQYYLEETTMNLENDRKYTSSHEWILDLGNGSYRVGLSDFAQHALGDIVFIDLPQVGDAVSAETSLGDIESVKAVSEVLSPVSGTVAAVNEELSAVPESINADPYGAWLIEVKDATAFAELMDASAYEAFCANA
jgi:glycine cleavage system H protein